MKYLTCDVVFSEIPEEITLEFGISNCPFRCEGCHSPFLWEDKGKEFTVDEVKKYIEEYSPAISCILISGGDRNPWEVSAALKTIKFFYPKLKTAWYSGSESLSKDIDLAYLDYVKLGPYIEKLGGLTSPTTNQRLYKVNNGELVDITEKFWK